MTTSKGQFVFINKSGPDRALRGQEVGTIAAHVAKLSHARRKIVARTAPRTIRLDRIIGNATYIQVHDYMPEETQACRPVRTRAARKGGVTAHLEYSRDSDRTELNGWAQLFFRSVAWPRAASYFTGALLWDDLTAQYCYGPPQTYAMLACGEYMKAMSTAEGSSTVPKILVIRKAEAAAAVNSCIEQNHITKSLALAILHLAALEVQMGNCVTALVHQRAAGKVMASIRQSTWTTEEILYIHDNWIATPCMPVASQIPACNNPGPWNDGHLLDSAEYMKFLRTRCLTARTIELFVDIRELFRVRDIALAGDSTVQAERQAWIHLKASSIKQALTSTKSEMDELCLGIGSSEQTQGQRILTSTITSALSWLMTSTFCGAFSNVQMYTLPPLLTTLISMETTSEASDFRVATDLALWLHFVAWLTRNAAHHDKTADAHGEARSRIRILARSLCPLDGRKIVSMLENFVYSRWTMKDALDTFIADGCGLTSYAT